MNKIIVVLMLIVGAMLLNGCTSAYEYEVDQLRASIAEKQHRLNVLAVEQARLEKMQDALLIQKGVERYVLTLEVKQEHMSLDLMDHLKDDMNALTLQVPVDKEYYNSVMVGQKIADEWRTGSMMMKGSFGSWNVRVIGKDIVRR